MSGTGLWSRDPGGTRGRDLAKDATFRLRPGRRGVILRAECGLVLVTQEGDRDDHVLEAGDELWLPSGGVVAAWALEAARVTMCDPRDRELDARREARAEPAVSEQAAPPDAGPQRVGRRAVNEHERAGRAATCRPAASRPKGRQRARSLRGAAVDELPYQSSCGGAAVDELAERSEVFR